MKQVYPKPCNYDEPMVASFKYTTTTSIIAIAVDEYKSTALAKKDLATRGPLWKADGQDGKAITITMNKDRTQVMVINVNGKQCLQIALEKVPKQGWG